jgi:hypothetical protein
MPPGRVAVAVPAGERTTADTPPRLLPPNLWLPAKDSAHGAICARCGYNVWWSEDIEEPALPDQRLWHCRTCQIPP